MTVDALSPRLGSGLPTTDIQFRSGFEPVGQGNLPEDRGRDVACERSRVAARWLWTSSDNFASEPLTIRSPLLGISKSAAVLRDRETPSSFAWAKVNAGRGSS